MGAVACPEWGMLFFAIVSHRKARPVIRTGFLVKCGVVW